MPVSLMMSPVRTARRARLVRTLWLGCLLLLATAPVLAETPYTRCAQPLSRPLGVLSSGWSHDLAQTRASTGLTAADLPSLRLQWAFVFDDTEQPRSLPAITRQAIFLGSQEGALWALDRQDGCVHWRFQARKKIRSAVTVVDLDDRSLVVFGDDSGHVYTLDALTGERVWEAKVDDHRIAIITGSPVYHEGHVYVPASSLEVTLAVNPFYHCCTFRGSVSKFDVRSGERRWQYYTIPEPPSEVRHNAIGVKQFGPSGAPVWSSPTLDPARNRLYLGTGQNYSSPTDSNSDAIHAVDLSTGQRVWRRQFLAMDGWNAACQLGPLGTNCPDEKGPDYDFGAPPILLTRADGQALLVAGQKSGMVYAMDPDSGELVWQQSVGRGGMLGGVHWGMAADADADAVYVPISDFDIPIVKAPPGEPKPSLSRLDLRDGAIRWQVPAVFPCLDAEGDSVRGCRNGLSAAVTLIPGAVLAPGLDGVIHAYDVTSGHMVWEFDTKGTVQGVNGLVGAGGTLDAGGVVAVDGQLFLNSGYGGLISAGGRSGNVFLVLGK